MKNKQSINLVRISNETRTKFREMYEQIVVNYSHMWAAAGSKDKPLIERKANEETGTPRSGMMENGARSSPR